MFLGHFALALGTKRWTPGVSLGVLVLAAQWADLLWPVLLLAGVERVVIDPGVTVVTPLYFVHYPWTHSLLMGLVWGVVAGGLTYGWRRRAREAAVVGALVPSHWVLDLVVHRPDLPVWAGGPVVGFGLWNSLAGTLVVEIGLLVGGAWLYWRTTDAADRIGRVGTAGFVGLLVVGYLGTVLGPTPPDATTVAFSALTLWLLVALAWWVDGHRTASGA